MEVCLKSSWLLLLGVLLLSTTLQGVQGHAESEGPSETECRPYIEKALRELEHPGAEDASIGDSKEDQPTVEISNDSEQISKEDEPTDEPNEPSEDEKLPESVEEEAPKESAEEAPKESVEEEAPQEPVEEETTKESAEEEQLKESLKVEQLKESAETEAQSVEAQSQETEGNVEKSQLTEQSLENQDSKASQEEILAENTAESLESIETQEQPETQSENQEALSQEEDTKVQEDTIESTPEPETTETTESLEETDKTESVQTESAEVNQDSTQSQENLDTQEINVEQQDSEVNTETPSLEEPISTDSVVEESIELDTPTNEEVEKSAETEKSAISKEESEEDTNQASLSAEAEDSEKSSKESIENIPESEKPEQDQLDVKSDEVKDSVQADDVKESEEKEQKDAEESISQENKEIVQEQALSENKEASVESAEDDVRSKRSVNEEVQVSETEESVVSQESAPVEEELINEVEIPDNLRQRDHVESLLKLDQEATESERIIEGVSEITLRELKRLYENAIKPLEILYKYRDLSNRHFGDSEIFSKPLILFMGPWSGGKSSIINYLVNIEYNETSLKTGAEPSPAYFNILMHGDDIEILEGTELAADYTFSGLQKFGQGLEERLRGFKLPSKLLEKVNIVEIPGILEVRKQVSRVFPFNDACQWFIDRADVIFLVYDPSKLDVGPETEAILDQLKGREYQTRIILNKADQVKPEELMRVQGALIWNISPLMSSPQPPIMYTTSLWSRPYETWAPVRLLQAQERAFLRDVRSAIDRRIENKIASARRFAVRVRNHAKMVDCYLTTYYNHKSIFGNRKQVSDQIIEHPQDYHIYEGLSTLTNISRYDLPDPDVYKDFFRLNPLYEFQQLSATCTYFRGCPINKLDIAIAYDLPELLGKHKKNVEAALAEASQNQAKKKS